MNLPASHLPSKKELLSGTGRERLLETGRDKEVTNKQKNYFGQGHFLLGDNKVSILG